MSSAVGHALVLDGDLLPPGAKAGTTGETERAVAGARASGWDSAPRRSGAISSRATSRRFEQTRLYERVFAQADRSEGRPVPRAVVPNIALKSPKITRKLTTEWFARRVDERFRRCLAKAAAPSSG